MSDRRAQWERMRDRQDKVRAAALDGMSAKKISKVLKCSESTVWADLGHLGIRLRDIRASIPTEKQKEAHMLRACGATYKEIGVIMKCSAMTALSHVRAFERKTKKPRPGPHSKNKSRQGFN